MRYLFAAIGLMLPYFAVGFTLLFLNSILIHSVLQRARNRPFGLSQGFFAVLARLPSILILSIVCFSVVYAIRILTMKLQRRLARWMQWIVELLEVFSGYLSNTLSFMRVAGLGIAHVCLMISFFTLAGMTSGLFSVVVLILGNILVIGLEGLCAGIQALRLSYYEFFTKFFHGTGELYTPISLNSRYK